MPGNDMLEWAVWPGIWCWRNCWNVLMPGADPKAGCGADMSAEPAAAALRSAPRSAPRSSLRRWPLRSSDSSSRALLCLQQGRDRRRQPVVSAKIWEDGSLSVLARSHVAAWRGSSAQAVTCACAAGPTATSTLGHLLSRQTTASAAMLCHGSEGCNRTEASETHRVVAGTGVGWGGAPPSWLVVSMAELAELAAGFAAALVAAALVAAASVVAAGVGRRENREKNLSVGVARG